MHFLKNLALSAVTGVVALITFSVFVVSVVVAGEYGGIGGVLALAFGVATVWTAIEMTVDP